MKSFSFKWSALASVIFLINGLNAQAQISQPNPKNPEAYALARSLDYPVNSNNGVPNISVPIFEVAAGSLNYKVALSYHSGGIKVGQLPTWIGMNWSMNAAPQITRSINALDDITNGGYLGNNTIAAYNSSNPRPGNSILSRIVRGELDEQPDEFNYSLLQKSGKFFYQKYTTSTYKAITVPYDQLDIQYNSSTYEYTILDVDGTKYEFGGTGYLEQSLPSSSIVTWKCKKIISPNLKDTITFEYFPIQTKYKSSYAEEIEIYDAGVTPIPFDYQALSQDIYNNNAYRNNPLVMTNTKGYPYPTKATYFVFGVPGTPITYNFNSPNIFFDEAGVSPQAVGNTSTLQNRALKSINFKGNKIEFFPKQQPDEILDSIRISNYLGEKIRTIKLIRTGSNYLLSDLVFSSGQNIESKYGFEYLPGIYSAEENLPSDAWGYPNPSNGYMNPQTLDYFNDSNLPFQWITGSIASDSPNSNQPGQDFIFPIGKNTLESNEEDMKAGVIKKIIYPGGGYTEFEFEANRFRMAAYPNPEKLAGGLRIKSIKNFSGSTTVPATEKHYKYNSNGFDGAGMVVIDPALYNFEYLENGHWTSDTEGEYTQGDYSNFRKRTFYKSTIDNAFFSDGSPVNYQTISIYESENGQQTGFTSYSYNIHHSNFRITNTPLTQHQLDIDNGILLAEHYYAYDNGQFKWVKAKNYEYDIFYLPEKIHVGKAFNTYPLMGSVKGNDPVADYGRLIYLSYGLDVGYTRIKKETDSTRSLSQQDQKVLTTKNYYYDNNNHIYPTRIESANSKGENIVAYTSYPQDYAADNGMISSLTANHKLNLPIEQVVAKKTPEQTIINASLNTYGLGSENYYDKSLSVDLANPLSLSGFKFSNVLQGQWPEGLTKQALSSDPAYNEKLKADQYDQFGNVVQITTKQNVLKTYIWSYKGMYPVFEIDDISYNSIKNSIGAVALNNFEKSSPDQAAVEAFRTQIKQAFPNQFIKSYVYKPLIGMISQTDVKGMTTYYDYDVFGRLQYIKDQNQNIVKSNIYHYKN